MLITLLLNSSDLLLVPFCLKIASFLIKILDSKIGERVVLEGYDGISQDKEKVIDPKKKKVLEIVLPHLKTDENGYAVFQGIL